MKVLNENPRYLTSGIDNFSLYHRWYACCRIFLFLL